MDCQIRLIRQPRGTALIVAMAIVMLLAGVTTALLMELHTRADRTEADKEDVKSFEAAEAGLDAAIANLNAGGNGCLGIGWWTGSRSNEAKPHSDTEADPVDLDDDGFPDSNEVADSTDAWWIGDKVAGSPPGVTATDNTLLFVRPASASTQPSPPSEDRKTPSPFVPAYTWPLLPTAIEYTYVETAR